MLRRQHIQGFIVAVFFFCPLFIFAQAPSIADLEAQIAAKQQRYAKKLKEVEALEAKILLLENNELDYAARLAQARKNFEVRAPTRDIADKVCNALAQEWMQSKFDGMQLYKPCMVRVKVGQIVAAGATTFSFADGKAYGFDMTVQGSLESILDSIVPHEATHIFNALDVGRPLPRWADEGVATLAENESERKRQLALAQEVNGTNRFIPLRDLLDITEYPKNMSHVLTLYAEGASLSDFLVGNASTASGKQWTREEARQWMVAFMQNGYVKGWDAALYNLSKTKEKPLGSITNVAQLHNAFTQWLKRKDIEPYVFKITPTDSGKNTILPVNYFDEEKNIVVPAY